MNTIKKIAAAMAAVFCLTTAAGCSSEKGFMGNTEEVALEPGDYFAVISIMDYGDITVKLFPGAAPNAVKQFIKLAENNSYDGRTIHRVVKDKLIQGGSLTGTGFDGDVAKQEHFDIETSKYMCHYYGALCMAKSADGNYRQFYIVNNNTPAKIDELAQTLKAQLDDPEIGGKMLEEDKKYYKEYSSKLANLPEEVKERYSHVGGLYDLDGEDTVFGQVVDGFDVLEKLNKVETVNGNKTDDKQDIASKPIDEIVIEKIEILKIAAEEETEETTATQKTRPTKAPDPAEDSEQIVVDDNNAPDTEDKATDPEPAAPSEDDTSTGPEDPAEDEDPDSTKEDTQGENADTTEEDTEPETADNGGEGQPEEETDAE